MRHQVNLLALMPPDASSNQKPKPFTVHRCDLAWAQEVARTRHYLRAKVHDQAHPFAYQITETATGRATGMMIFGTPHFTKCKGLFGYEGLPTKWQVLMLSRLWVHPDFQKPQGGSSSDRGNHLTQWGDNLGRTDEPESRWGDNLGNITEGRISPHAQCVASCAIAQVTKRINQDWLAHHPPRYRDQPYNLQLILSYSDLRQGHVGTVYQASNFLFDALVVSDKVSRHSHEQKEPHTLARYAYWLRRVYDPIQGKWVHYRLPHERIVKPHVKPRELMRKFQ